MDALPVELLIHIFWYLDFNDIKKIVETNRRHFNVVKKNKKYLPGLNSRPMPYWYWCKARNFIPNHEE